MLFSTTCTFVDGKRHWRIFVEVSSKPWVYYFCLLNSDVSVNSLYESVIMNKCIDNGNIISIFHLKITQTVKINCYLLWKRLNQGDSQTRSTQRTSKPGFFICYKNRRQTWRSTHHEFHEAEISSFPSLYPTPKVKNKCTVHPCLTHLLPSNLIPHHHPASPLFSSSFTWSQWTAAQWVLRRHWWTECSCWNKVG